MLGSGSEEWGGQEVWQEVTQPGLMEALGLCCG